MSSVTAWIASAATQFFAWLSSSKIAQTVATIALNVVVAAGIRALAGKPKAGFGQDENLATRLQAAVPRSVLVGNVATGGTVVWAKRGGANDRYLYYVIQLSDWWTTSLVGVYAEGRQITFAGNWATGYAACLQYLRRGATALWLRYYDGRQVAADSELTSVFGAEWTANAIGYGCSYVVVKLDRADNGAAFPNGDPPMYFELQGAPVYDPRADSTVAGGSGAQRKNDATTWAFSANGALVIAAYCRGFRNNGSLVVGVGAVDADIPDAALIAAANVCDEIVDGEARYRIGGELSSAETPRETLADLTLAIDGEVIDQGGSIIIRPGVVPASTLAITDDDLLLDEPFSLSVDKPTGELINAVSGTYPDPAAAWQEVPFPPLRNATWEADDGGVLHEETLGFRYAPYPRQVQRIAKRRHLSSRNQRRVSLVLPLFALELDIGDTVSWTSARYGWTNKLWRVTGLQLTETLRVSIEAEETDPAIDTPSAYVPPSIGSGNYLPDAYVAPALTVAAVPIASGATVLPALSITWSAVTLPHVERMSLRITRSGAAAVITAATPSAGSAIFAEGVVAGVYAVEAQVEGNGRSSGWGTPASVTVTTDFVASTAAIASSIVNQGSLATLNFTTLGANVRRENGATIVTDALAITSLGTAAAIAGQAAAATDATIETGATRNRIVRGRATGGTVSSTATGGTWTDAVTVALVNVLSGGTYDLDASLTWRANTTTDEDADPGFQGVARIRVRVVTRKTSDGSDVVVLAGPFTYDQTVAVSGWSAYQADTVLSDEIVANTGVAADRTIALQIQCGTNANEVQTSASSVGAFFYK